MNENIQKWMQSARTYFTGLSVQKKFLAGAVGLTILAVGIVTAIWTSQDPYEQLYSDLQKEDSRGVAKRLGEVNIPYHITDDGSTISVPASRVHQARMELAKSGLPGNDVVGFEKFDSSTLGMSTYIQKIQYVRAVQGELIRSIEKLAAVKRARVHISIPPKKTFLEEEEPPKASVVLELRSGQQPSKSEITGIAHLVASAVEGLKVNQVTIVDTQGNFLHRPEDSGPGVSSTLLEMERGIESDYERRIVDLLTPVVGLGKVRAKVTAEMDSSRTNTTEETYDPDRAVLRNALKNDEVQQGSRPNPIGIPGSRSNLPGTENQNPPVPTANSSSEKNMQNLNYAIPKKIQTTDKPSGNIKRLTVAVVVDGYYNKVNGKPETETFLPRTEEELKRLQDIVANAVGFDSQRRDSITVSSLPFKSAELLPLEEEESTKAFNIKDLYQNGMRNGVIALGLLLFFFMVVRPFLKWAMVNDLQKEAQSLPRTVAELEAAQRDQGLLSLANAASGMDEGEPIEKKEEEELKQKILKRLEEVPKKGYRVIQDWIDEDQSLRIPENPDLVALAK